MKISFKFLLALGIIFLFQTAISQTDNHEKKNHKKSHISFRDSLDNAFDLSDWLIYYNGFVPIPVIVTEPSLGGFGGGLAPVFIKQREPIVKDGKVYPVPPTVTAAGGVYTLNNTWAVALGRSSSIPKWGLRYAGGAAYSDVNMTFYHTFESLNNKEYDFDFNMRAIPIFVSFSKEFKDPRFTVGISYMFMNNKLKLESNLYDTLSNNYPDVIEHLNEFIDKEDMGNIFEGVSHNLAHLGFTAQFDSRDNTFTPNKGIKTYITGMWNSPYVGGEYKYGQFEGAFYWYTPIVKKLINGFRFDMQQTVGDNIPFYMKPFIDMRGVPMERYQGSTTMLAELEERWDFYKRWSLVFFGGAGKAFDDFSEFKDADWAYSYGLGGRYLIARKIKLRMGVDLAMGPEGFTYYIVFGTSWLRQ